MSGGVVQLVATGPQDAWLTGKPEVSFFRSNYRRSTHYANSIERQIIQGVASPGNVSTIRFEKRGDLLSYVYLTALDATGNVVDIGTLSAVNKAELYIGGQLIDTQYDGYNVQETYAASQTLNQSATSSSIYPFKFFFCKDWAASLPLVGLQFHDVEIRITWSSTVQTNSIVNGNGAGPYQYQAWTNFIYLDQAERDWFAKTPHDMLVTQVQNIVPVNNNVQEIAIAQPVKYLMLNIYSSAGSPIDPGNKSAANTTLKIQINGVDVGDARPLLHWTAVPFYYNVPFGASINFNRASANGNIVALIPFCLDTSKLQPTGTLNFSRLDSFRIVLPTGTTMSTLTAGNYIYAVGYNILRIQNGLGSLLYAS